MNRTRVWSDLIRVFAFLTPDVPQSWLAAIRAELPAIPAGPEQSRFAMSSLRALMTISFGTLLRRWAAHARVLAIAALLGFAIATLDMTSETRWPLRSA